jgi:hypothetical protein
VHAAVLACGDDAAASHRSAMLIWGLTGIGSAPVEVTVPYSAEAMPTGVIVHRSRRIEEAVPRRGIVTTGVERTLLELGAVVPPVVVEKALASALRQHLTTCTKVDRYLLEHGGRGRHGTTVLRESLGYYNDGDRPPGSDGEVAFLRELRAAGIEPPVRQYTIDLPSGAKATMDFAWPDRRKAIEFKGSKDHTDSRAQDDDYWREGAIQDLGWELRCFAPYSLKHRPEAVAQAVVRFLCGMLRRNGAISRTKAG